MFWMALHCSETVKKHMLSILKKHLSTAAKNSLKAKLPPMLFRKASYSQCGEDLIVAYALEILYGSRPKKYLDVGANHPFNLSNTALLYQQGGNGTLIEPDPYFSKLLKKKRPKDRVLQCGVHFSGDPCANLYVMDPPTLNTFSREEMERCLAMGHELKNTLLVPLQDINSILETAGDLDFMNLDIEGLDKLILEMIDWKIYHPTCICVETLTYETQKEPRKLNDIIELLLSHGYMLYADTYINSIFVDRGQWQQRWNRK